MLTDRGSSGHGTQVDDLDGDEGDDDDEGRLPEM